jgi:hypothetical protein
MQNVPVKIINRSPHQNVMRDLRDPGAALGNNRPDNIEPKN